MATNGSFYWNELMTRDAEAAKKFYGATLGWTFEAMDQGEGANYWIAKVGEESVAGIYLLFNALIGAAVLWWLLGIALVVLGIINIVRAFTFRGE